MGDIHHWTKNGADSWVCRYCKVEKRKRQIHSNTSFARYTFHRQDGSRIGHSVPECHQQLRML